MNVCRAELWCDGCRTPYGVGIPHEDPDAMRVLWRNLAGLAREDGWTIDGKARWCPACTVERAAPAGTRQQADTQATVGTGGAR
jgi:hypothetical protein